MMNERVLVVLSGGLDSTVLLYHSRALGARVEAVSFDYGQKHSKELLYAKATCKLLEVPHHIIDVSFMRSVFAASSQTDPSIEVPHGHYEDITMQKTVVPNRNMVMLSLATALAIRLECRKLAYGAHGGDHAIYHDCRPEFIHPMMAAIAACDANAPRLVAPFIILDKAQIVHLGERLAVLFQNTWSCYEGGDVHCGKCGTCVERREAFTLARVKDPTVYAP